jgi:hypothetical protein
MTDKDRQKMLKAWRHQMDEMKWDTIIDPNSMVDVLDEATTHLVEHFKKSDEPDFCNDYVFIMGKAYLGRQIENGANRAHPCAFFMNGDLHEWAHDLADLMRIDDTVARQIFHAVELYNGGGGRPIKKIF